MSFAPIQIHSATVADVALLAPLFNDYRYFYGKPADLPRAEKFLRERLTAGESVVLWARVGERATPAAFTQLYPTFSSVSTARVWVLNDLYVAPEFRRGGIAQALIAAARTHAMTAGAIRLDLSTGESNHSAQTLYESLGFVRETGFRYYSLALPSA